MPTASSKSTPAEGGDRPGPARRPPRLLPAELFLFAAETRSEVLTRLGELEAYLGEPGPAPLHDLAFTVSRSYAPGGECVALVASSHEDLRARLATAREKLGDESCALIHDRSGVYYSREGLGGKMAFLFPGENAQYPNMLRELWLSFPEVREAFDAADAACRQEDDGFEPSALNFPAPGSNGTATGDEMAQWEKAVMLVHTANTAMGRILDALELRPDAVVGHSFGELAALERAGVLRAGEGADRVRFGHHAYRHLRELSWEKDLPVGRLLAVGGVEKAQIEQILARYPDALRMAMQNCPHQYVLCASGPEMETVIAEAERWLSGEGAICSPLPIRRPYHTPFFEPAFPFEKGYFEEIGVHPPQIEVYSCATTEPFPSEPEAIVEVAARHWMSCVRFQDTIEKMYERGFRAFVDVGPRGNLAAFVGDILKDKPHLVVALNRPQRSDVVQLLNGLAVLAARGVPLRTHSLHEGWGSRAVDLGGTAGAGSGKKPLNLQLATDLPTMKTEGLAVGRPGSLGAVQTAPTPPAPATVMPPPAGLPATPAASPASAPAAPGEPAASGAEARSGDEETAAVMLSYMDTMERFLAAQGTLLGSLLGSVPGEGTTEGTPGGRFPFLGEIQELVPGASLVARRVLDVEEDRFLEDHALGTTVSATDPSLKALPVMPLTFSLEVAAEAGAALFPELKVIAVEDVRAHRWIFFDEGAVPLQVNARRIEAPGAETRVKVILKQETEQDPRLFPTMVEVTAVLASREKEPPPSRVASLPPSAACDWTEADIYPTRTFHGPRFQGLRGIARRSAEGLDGTLEVLPWSGLLQSRPRPELELDPLLIDILGQTVWLWGSPEPFLGTAYLPFGAAAVRQYGPPLPAGSRLDLTLRVRGEEPQIVTTGLEAVDAEGKVRLAIEQLGDREFPLTPALHRLMLAPLDHHFAEVRFLELSPPDRDPVRIGLATVEDAPYALLEGSFGVWRKALAFLVLGREERAEWARLDGTLRRQIQWLLGRVAVKDALRALLRERSGPRRGGADLALGAEPGGRPVVTGGWPAGAPGAPGISISHTEGLVAAVAAEGGVDLGVDTEKIRPPSPDLLDGAFSPEERAWIPADAPEAERSEWVFRLWCAKEAAGKARGTGVPVNARELPVSRCDRETGEVTIGGGGEEEVSAWTWRLGDHVLAVAVRGAPRGP